MNKPTPRNLALFIVIGLVILVSIGAAVMAYSVYIKRSDAGIVRVLGSWLPAARVDGKTISYGDVLKTRDTLKVYLKSEAAQAQGFTESLTPDLEKKATVERLMRDHVVAEMAKEKNVTLTDEDVRKEFDQMTASASATMPNVGEFLAKNFGWNEAEFQANVVRPALLESRVAMTYGTSTEAQITGFQTEVDKRLTSSEAKIYLKY